MQHKNFIAWIVISALIIAGWWTLRPMLFPPRQRDNKKPAVAEKKKEPEKKPAPPRTWFKLPQDTRNTLLVAQAVSSRTLTSIAHLTDRTEFVVKSKAPEVPAVAAEKPKVYELGDDSTFLKVKVTTHGAGVQQVTLNNFNGADRYGLANGETLHLVPEDPYMPSFRMYHYPDAKDEDARPVDTLGRMNWKCDGKAVKDIHGVQHITFSTRVPAPFEHLTIIKTYSLAADAYHVGLRIEIKNTGGIDPAKAPAFRYQLAGAHHLPLEGEWYTNTFRNSVVVTAQGKTYLARHPEDAAHISRREGGDKVEPRGGEQFIQYAGVHTQYFASMIVVDNEQPPADEGGEDIRKIIAWARPTLEASEDKGILRLIKKNGKDSAGITVEVNRRDKHFILLPEAQKELEKIEKDEPVVVRFYRAEDGRLIAQNLRAGSQPHPFTDDITMRVVTGAIAVEKQVVHKYMLYHGPVKVRLLSQLGANSPPDKLVDRYADTLHLRRLTDFSNLGFFSWWSDLIITCTTVMHWLLNVLHGALHFILPNFLSYGLSIILLTVLVRGAMFPISRRQAYLSMRMQELAPEMKKLQEKYKNDPQARGQAMMELYRKHHVHPLGSCLPLLLQLPIFMGLYFALQESIHFRLQPFLWIRNLAAPDMLVWWGENIPLISDPDNQHGPSLFSFLYLGPYLNVLPIFAVALMIVQQKLLTPPPTDEQQEMTQKMMKYMMVVFGVMFYKVAAGLCIYFIASSLWGVAERKLLPKKKGPGAAQASPTGKPPPGAIQRKPRGPGKREVKKPDGTFQKMKDWWAEVLEQARKK